MMAIENQYFVTDYFSTEIESYNESQIRERFPINRIITNSGYYPTGTIYCESFGTRFLIPPLLNGASDWELLDFTLERASRKDFYPYRRCYQRSDV